MAITVIKKFKAVVEDLFFDSDGGGGTVTIPTSDGSQRSGTLINASHIPITNGTRSKKGADNVTITATNVDATLAHILDQLVQIPSSDIIVQHF